MNNVDLYKNTEKEDTNVIDEDVLYIEYVIGMLNDLEYALVAYFDENDNNIQGL